MFLPTSAPDALNFYSHPFDVLADAPATRATAAADPERRLSRWGRTTTPTRRPRGRRAVSRRRSAPYAVYAGTYTGNGTGQDLAAFPAPIHLFFTRPVGPPAAPAR